MERYVRPRIRTLLRTPDTQEKDLAQCPACNCVCTKSALAAALQVCGNCGHHFRLTAQERLAATLDAGFSLINLPKVPADPLAFRDQKKYADRLKEARARAGRDDALLVAQGSILGQACIAAAMDFSFMGGSMGAAVGAGLVAAAECALREHAPLIVFTASGGARMQEGALSLMQMPRSVIATQMLREKRLPFIVVFTDPTTGGVTASFAMLGDVHIAEPGALIGFAGARVIEQTVRETLPQGFQRAEYLHAHGMVDLIVHRGEMRETLARICGLLVAGLRDVGLEEEEPLTW